MDFETILVNREGAVVTLTLNRPAALNALSRQMAPEIEKALQTIEEDSTARVVLITGSPRPDGRPCFSAGADLKERHVGRAIPLGGALQNTLDAAAEVASATGPGQESVFSQVFSRLEAMQTPSIAVIDGICTTGGLELALCCDLRLAAETAQFSDVHVKRLGGIGLSGVSVRLPQLVGVARAKEFLWTGEAIDGNEAYKIGLVNRVYPSDQLGAAAAMMARTVALMSPAAIAASKAVVNASIHQSVQEGTRYSYLWSALIALRNELGIESSKF